MKTNPKFEKWYKRYWSKRGLCIYLLPDDMYSAFKCGYLAGLSDAKSKKKRKVKP